MLRIFFTGEDIARTRIAATADPLWELVLSIQMLRGQPGDLLFGDWRRATATTLRQRLPPLRWRLLMDLIPTIGYFPDFLNPAAAAQGLEHGLEAIRSTSRAALAGDLQRLTPPRRAGRDWKALAAGDPAELTLLTNVLRDYYRLAIHTLRGTLNAAVERDRRTRLHALAAGGVDAMLTSLRPMMTWSSGELRVPAHRDQKITLGGRGLLLVPSYFCVNHPMTLFDESLAPVLVYPVARVPDDLPLRGNHRSLAALLGPTRAAVLEAISGGGATIDIARRVGVSSATASEHATVLRNAGLVASYRDRNRTVHRLTPLGRALLAG